MLTMSIGGLNETGEAQPTVMTFVRSLAATVTNATGSGNWLEYFGMDASFSGIAGSVNVPLPRRTQ
jgi:hypothetical protein